MVARMVTPATAAWRRTVGWRRASVDPGRFPCERPRDALGRPAGFVGSVRPTTLAARCTVRPTDSKARASVFSINDCAASSRAVAWAAGLRVAVGLGGLRERLRTGAPARRELAAPRRPDF
jgi:hypothetical protein